MSDLKALANLHAKYKGSGNLIGFIAEAKATGASLIDLADLEAIAKPGTDELILAELKAIRALLEGATSDGNAMTVALPPFWSL